MLTPVQIVEWGNLFALPGWIHYLAFDLFVGTWIAKRSDEIGLSRLIQAPILALTFMFGPAGYQVFGIWQRFIGVILIVGLFARAVTM